MTGSALYKIAADGVVERIWKSHDTQVLALAVQPDGYPLVKPPRYFGGDLLDQGSWKHYWGDVGTLADNLRQHVNA